MQILNIVIYHKLCLNNPEIIVVNRFNLKKPPFYRIIIRQYEVSYHYNNYDGIKYPVTDSSKNRFQLLS